MLAMNFLDDHYTTIDGGRLPVRRARRGVLLNEAGTTKASRGPAGGGSYQTGLFGEEVVSDGMQRAGWRVLGHRVRTRWGELDLVARKGDMIVFGEVKTAAKPRAGMEELVGARAQHRLRRAAIAWMAANPRLQQGVQRYRFDVFLVYRDRRGGVERVDHIKDAF